MHAASSLTQEFSHAGKVHGSLARAGKVRGNAPKVAKQDKKKLPKGRAYQRLKYNRRFVNVGAYFTVSELPTCMFCAPALCPSASETLGLLPRKRVAASGCGHGSHSHEHFQQCICQAAQLCSDAGRLMVFRPRHKRPCARVQLFCTLVQTTSARCGLPVL